MDANAALREELIRGARDAVGIRYLSVIGLVCLCYDHVQTFPDEVVLVWKAPNSIAKWIFLFNRYLVLGCLLAIAHMMCGFGGGGLYTDAVCKGLLSTTSFASVISIGMANILVLFRVLLLWDNNRNILIVLAATFVVSFSCTLGFMIASVVKLRDGVQYIEYVHACSTTTTTPAWVGVWASPLLFELVTLLLTLYNAFSRPRSENTGLTSTLHRDGLAFFFAVTCFRTINIVFATSRYPNRILYAGFAVWAFNTVILNRLLIHIRRSEIRLAVSQKFALEAAGNLYDSDDDESANNHDEPPPSAVVAPQGGAFSLNGRASPFGLHVHLDEYSHHDHAAEVPTTYIEMQSFWR
ncbi:hypothetical protein OF83DRAFT_592264 [Amylostereum chailletii]|nr:hypothetical protein OF83DRAFT_592264 [Amylostereum chailletii]